MAKKNPKMQGTTVFCSTIKSPAPPETARDILYRAMETQIGDDTDLLTEVVMRLRKTNRPNFFWMASSKRQKSGHAPATGSEPTKNDLENTARGPTISPEKNTHTMIRTNRPKARIG